MDAGAGPAAREMEALHALAGEAAVREHGSDGLYP